MDEAQRLAEVLGWLCDESGRAAARSGPPEEPDGRRPLAGDERLVGALNEGLLRLVESRRPEAVDAPAVQTAISGVEYVAQGEILAGRRTRLVRLLPSFVFLVLLPIQGRSEALRVARRAAELEGGLAAA
jgi:hypothetical protein